VKALFHKLRCITGLLVILRGLAVAADEAPLPEHETRTARGLQLVYRFAAPDAHRTADGFAVTLGGCEADERAGEPVLPLCGVTVAIPPGKRVAQVRIIPDETTSIALDGPVRAGENILPLSADAQYIARARPDRAIYGSNRPFPSHETPRFRVDRQHGHDRLALALHPVQVIPAENRLLAHRVLTVEVEWAETLTSPAPLGDVAAETSAALPILLGPATQARLSPGVHEYVIVGDANLMTNTPPPWDFNALLNSRRTAGLTATNVSVAWITATYAGSDVPDKIRAFVRDAYQTWGTRFILLAGTQSLVPSRQLYCAFSSYIGYIPSDTLYYGCLDGDFNYDGDTLYGEPTDGMDGGDVDLLAEVSVGRFPIATTNEAANMIRKTILYEAAPTSSLSRVTQVGEYLGFGGPADYATGMMEQIRTGCTDAGFTTLGFENPAYGSFFDTSDTLYDAPDYTWPASQMISRLNGDFHVINHMGHGAYYFCFKLNLFVTADKQAIQNLTNNVCYLAYSQACDTGRFDDHVDCFAEQLVTTRAGAFAAVMNPRYGWGYQNSVDGPSHRFHRRFWDAVFARGKYHLGTMNQDSKERNRYLVTPGTGDAWRWCYYEITLFGDPATPFAARLLNFAPTFTHVPLENQLSTLDRYRIECTVGPVGLCQPGSPRLVWHSSNDPDAAHTNLLTLVEGSRYEAFIPAQPNGTRISYRLLAETLAGVAGQWPAGDTDHAFTIAQPFELTIQGEPAPYGTVTPPYGSSLMASGTVISASAPLRVDIAAGISQAATGWTGQGSVPPAGASNRVVFTLSETSTLNWLWTTEFALLLQSSVADLISSNTWHRSGAWAQSMTAPATLSKSGKTYVFCGWYLDGLRQPAAPGRVANPVTDILMSTNRVLSALYLTNTLDLDGNGIPDWWEYSYFGTNGVPAQSDPDGDGFGAEVEYNDRTDPTDSASFPAPPMILHVPLASPQHAPPPYVISATLTDSCTIASAELHWRRNGGAWEIAAFTSQGAGLFTGVIPAPGEPADRIDYRIMAADPIGLTATTGVYSVFLQYPRLTFGPVQGRDIVLLPAGVDHAALALTNTGNSRLNWSLARGSHEIVTPGAPGWLTNAWGQAWQVSATRSYSAPHAFFAHLTSGAIQVATPPVHACLDSPAMSLAPNARLFFRHWIKSELDQIAGYCFDGGMVEVSTNAGVSFAQLPGPYTHRIHGWLYSPWPYDTPCFAGNGSAGWTEVSFDLSAFAGQSVILRFHYGGDNNTDEEGWYLDDIRVGPLVTPDWPEWAVCGATAGSLVGGGSIAFPFDADASLSTMRDERLAVHILSNDPVTPNVYLDWTLKIRERPTLGDLRAWQSSTNGEGVVSLCFRVADPDGEPVVLQVDCSIDDGATWTAPWLTNTTVTVGTPPADTTAGQLAPLATVDGDGVRSNAVCTFWPTQTPEPGILLAPAARLRIRAANPYFSSEYLTSAAFLIDNQPPASPIGLQVSHTPEVWTASTHFAASWQPASDGDGIGGLRYLQRLAADGAAPTGPSTPATSYAGDMPEGSNIWFALQALDAYGNACAVERRGPFWVDATPPATTAARAWAVTSDSGNYAVGTNVLFAWGGFYDACSGIVGYHVRNLADPQVFQTADTVLVMMAQPPGSTNRLGVAAIDRAGNRSVEICTDILVLDPLSDPDGDGVLTRDEEIAGTDALAGSQRFTVGLSATSGSLMIQWPGRNGRTYSIERTATLALPAWEPLAGFSDLPGRDGIMGALVPQDAPTGFFRVRVTR
jgi:hypothetical protein